MKSFIKNNTIEIFTIIFSLIFSFWLMFATFSYENSSIQIASKAWSDFASHIPLIRSFSLGDNFPPEYPLFPGEPIRYHFLFYALVGLLEKTGLKIDYALNVPSAISFALLLITIYFLAKKLFKNKAVGILSVLFFLFNGSLSFLEFLKTHTLSLKTINDITGLTAFPSFGPYDQKVVSAFWNLNIYTNQRHLALPLAFLFIVVLLILNYEKKHKKFPLFIIVILGILTGGLSFLHSSAYIMAFAVFGILFFLLPNQRKSIFFMLVAGFLVSLPRIIFLKETMSYSPHIQFGYLITNELNLLNFISYWFMNFGLSFILIPLGFIFSSGLQKKIFIAFFSLFLIGNLIQFSPEIAGNHKFFNAFLIVANMYSAFVIVKFWRWNIFTKTITPVVVFLMIFSGIIDFFPVKNDNFISLVDYPGNPDIQWIMKNTSKDSIFLNSSYLYNPASLAGRKIFMGWPYFAWSLGHNTDKRGKIRDNLLMENDKQSFCKPAKSSNLDFIILNQSNPIADLDLNINMSFFEENFLKLYENQKSGIAIYSVKLSCLSIK